MGAKMEVREAQKNFPEALKSGENDLKIKNLDVHETLEHSLNTLVFPAPKASCELRFASKRLSS